MLAPGTLESLSAGSSLPSPASGSVQGDVFDAFKIFEDIFGKEERKTVMYAKIASAQFEDVKAFVAMAIKEMKNTRGVPKEENRLWKDA